jgi:hypothetical protein
MFCLRFASILLSKAEKHFATESTENDLAERILPQIAQMIADSAQRHGFLDDGVREKCYWLQIVKEQMDVPYICIYDAAGIVKGWNWPGRRGVRSVSTKKWFQNRGLALCG